MEVAEGVLANLRRLQGEVRICVRLQLACRRWKSSSSTPWTVLSSREGGGGSRSIGRETSMSSFSDADLPLALYSAQFYSDKLLEAPRSVKLFSRRRRRKPSS